jgi:hypothetical protein
MPSFFVLVRNYSADTEKNLFMKKIVLALLPFFVLTQTHAQNLEEKKDIASKSYLSLQLGPSLSTGDFARKDINSDQAGFAKTGLAVDLNYVYSFSENIGLAASAFFNINSLAIKKIRELTGVSTLKTDHWQSIGLAVGPAFSYPFSDKVRGDLKIMGGIASANSPDVRTNGFLLADEDWVTAALFQTGCGIRVDLGKHAFFASNLDFRYINPRFEITLSSGEQEPRRQQMSTLNLTCGLGVRF